MCVCVRREAGTELIKDRKQSQSFSVSLTLPSSPFLSHSVPSPPSVPFWLPPIFSSSLPLPSLPLTPPVPGPSPFPSFPILHLCLPSAFFPSLQLYPITCPPPYLLPLPIPFFLAAPLTLHLSPHISSGLGQLSRQPLLHGPLGWGQQEGRPEGPGPTSQGVLVSLGGRCRGGAGWKRRASRGDQFILTQGTAPGQAAPAREWLSQECAAILGTM